MQKQITKYIKYLPLAGTILVALVITMARTFNHSLKFKVDKCIPYNLDKEGPFIALQGDSTAIIQYIHGNQKDGFKIENQFVSQDTTLTLPVYYPLDNSEFYISMDFKIQNEEYEYTKADKIFIVSDLEGNFKTFRNLLQANDVLDKSLNWSFGKGRLVLLGDFMDRGYFVTQTLWLIYKLEKEAEKYGGKVHYILGNHEINNLQGYYQFAAKKYLYITNTLGIERNKLYNPKSFLGQWLAAKNVIEKIGDFLFVHGGLHPDFSESNLEIAQINEQIKSNYHNPLKMGNNPTDELLYSTKKSPAWYRGYFTDKPSQEKIDHLLKKFDVTKIIVGHTTLPKVDKYYGDSVIGIDVKNPQDHLLYFPERRTEALLWEDGIWYRVNDKNLKQVL